MSKPVDDLPAASRLSPFRGCTMASRTMRAWQNPPTKAYAMMVAAILAFTAGICALFLVVQSFSEGRADWIQQVAGYGFPLLIAGVLFAGVYGWSLWGRRREVGPSVTNDDPETRVAELERDSAEQKHLGNALISSAALTELSTKPAQHGGIPVLVVTSSRNSRRRPFVTTLKRSSRSSVRTNR